MTTAPLLNSLPMRYIVFADRRIERCTQQYFQFVYFWRLFFNDHAVANGAHMLICQARETFDVNSESYPARAHPAYCSGQHTVLNVECTLILKDFTPCHVEALPMYKEFDRYPV